MSKYPFMKNTQRAILLSIGLLTVTTTSCKDEKEDACVAGGGGTVDLVLFPQHHSEPISGIPGYVDSAFIKFNTREFPGDNRMSYTAPLKDMLFDIEHLANIAQVAELPGFEEAGLDTAQAVLEECAKLNEGVIAPLNWEGDKYPSSFHDGKVTTTPGFKEAFKQYAEGGWQGLQHPVDFGGQGLPKTIGAACGEILNSANMSFALCPLLTDGAIEALLTAGSDELKATYLEKLVSGQWTGTMNLTEPQAGSDLGLLRMQSQALCGATWCKQDTILIASPWCTTAYRTRTPQLVCASAAAGTASKARGAADREILLIRYTRRASCWGIERTPA